jgi:hypothetical protein
MGRQGGNNSPSQAAQHVLTFPDSTEWSGKIRVLGNNGTRNRCKRSMLGRKCLTFCERQANMEKWARIGSQKSSAKAETCATTFAKPNRQPIMLYAFMP